jgi:RNA polymerase sigma factor (TIGR02999 family)
MHSEPENLTELVNLWKKGDHDAGDVLFAAVQSRLRKIANKLLYKRGGFQRMQATEVVNQVYLRMLNERKAECLSRDEFIGIAIRLIDRTILDAMRYDRASVRDFRAEIPDQEMKAGDNANLASYDAATLMLELNHVDKALEELESENEIAHAVLIRKIFGDETLRAISQDLNISEDAAGRKWTFGKSFLASRLSELRNPARP